MSAVDEAIGRLTTWGQGVLALVNTLKDSNDQQTAVIGQLQEANATLAADDASDTAEIERLTEELARLQEEIAGKINTAIDALENPPAPEEPEEPEVPVDPPVETEAPAEEEPAPPVEENP